MRRWRVAGVSGFWFVSTLSATLGSLLLATTMQSHPVAGPTLRLNGTQFGPEANAGRLKFAPISPKILSGVPGLAAIQDVLALSASPEPAPDEESAQAGHSSRNRSPSPSPSAGPAAQGPDLRVEMMTDRVVARPGDIITYTFRIRNAGNRRANGISVASHIPEHTTFVASSDCGGGPVSVEPNPGGAPRVCANPPQPSPGEHGYQEAGDSLGAGEELVKFFKVQVDADAPDGFELHNHTHVSAPGLPTTTSNEIVTVVRIR